MKNHANTLLIGYGNSLREDDGFGIKVASLLSGLDGVDLMQNFQLTPEMCELFPKYNNIIFIDANIEAVAGVFAVPLPNISDPFNHTVLPWQLIKYAEDLYGFDGKFYIFSVGGFSFGYKEELSDLISLRALELSSYLRDFIKSFCH